MKDLTGRDVLICALVVVILGIVLVWTRVCYLTVTVTDDSGVRLDGAVTMYELADNMTLIGENRSFTNGTYRTALDNKGYFLIYVVSPQHYTSAFYLSPGGQRSLGTSVALMTHPQDVRLQFSNTHGIGSLNLSTSHEWSYLTICTGQNVTMALPRVSPGGRLYNYSSCWRVGTVSQKFINYTYESLPYNLTLVDMEKATNHESKWLYAYELGGTDIGFKDVILQFVGGNSK